MKTIAILLIILSMLPIVSCIRNTGKNPTAKQIDRNISLFEMELNNIGMIAFQYHKRPEIMGGGGGSYANFADHLYEIHQQLTDSPNAVYTAEVINHNNTKGTHVRLKAVAKFDETIVRWLLIDLNGNMKLYKGDDKPTP